MKQHKHHDRTMQPLPAWMPEHSQRRSGRREMNRFFRCLFIVLLSVVVVAFASRTYGPEGLGQIYYSVALVSLFTAVATLSMDNVAVNRLVRQGADEGEVLGTACSASVGPKLVARRGVALATALSSALRVTGLSIRSLGHIQAHGLSTQSCDSEEAQAIESVLGADANRIPVTAAKSYFGNLGAGSGMVELIAGILTLRHGWLFPVLNHETPDPECHVLIAKNDVSNPGSSFVNLNVTPQGQASAAIVRAA